MALTSQPRYRPLSVCKNGLEIGRNVAFCIHVHDSITDADTAQYPTDVNFQKWFQRQLKRREMSQAEFARFSSIPQSTVNTWWKGNRVPDSDSCDLIADALGVDLDLVLWQAGHRPMTQPVSPDDPRVDIHGLVDRVEWTPGNVKMITRILRTMLEDQA